jgi:hypothetical protein
MLQNAKPTAGSGRISVVAETKRQRNYVTEIQDWLAYQNPISITSSHGGGALHIDMQFIIFFFHFFTGFDGLLGFLRRHHGQRQFLMRFLLSTDGNGGPLFHMKSLRESLPSGK